MTIWVLMTLAGYVVEIIGAFVLAAEAIGVQRIHAWSDRYLSISSQLRTPPPDTIVRPGLARICVSVIGCVGGVIGIEIAKHPWPPVARAVGRFYTPLAVLIGMIVAPFIYFGLAELLRIIATLLAKLHRATEARAVGAIGFALLFLGFVFQFGGTLGSALQKSSG